ncbi:RNA-binding protein 44 [Nelusetta ayraudi]|uniref:RNA-binding protein 44 n=1 Tax=Nelusetta ayraudi TaxID=303726 RepID=UPI003F708729
MELRNEDPVADEAGWSHDLSSSIMVDDNSILAFQASNKSSNNDVSAQPSVDPCGTAGAAPTTRSSVLTQTDRPGTAEALVNTEVSMSDLDYLAEEFMKLQRAKEEWKKKKATLKRTLKKQCSCIQRAQQAELSLLALQYSMCRVHCSRLCSNPQRSQSKTTSKTPRANMAAALQKLESDYNHMRQEILTGVPLEQLRPLCVDLTEGSCIPSQIHADLPEDVQSGQVNLHKNTSPREQEQFLDKEKSSVELKSEDGKRDRIKHISQEEKDNKTLARYASVLSRTC